MASSKFFKPEENEENSVLRHLKKIGHAPDYYFRF